MYQCQFALDGFSKPLKICRFSVGDIDDRCVYVACRCAGEAYAFKFIPSGSQYSWSALPTIDRKCFEVSI